MDTSTNDCMKQIDELLAVSNQAWLFEAGISLNAGIPLIGPLTDRVYALADTQSKKLLDAIKTQLPEKAHIEYILSHLGDYVAIAERSKEQKVKIGSEEFNLLEMNEVHEKILKLISDAIRWGFKPAKGGNPEVVGTWEHPIVTIDAHKSFISALFNRSQAGIAERRGPVSLFTTNYDTLLEDALSLCCCSYWDGFSGGSVAYRSFRYGAKEPEENVRARVIKLHGSIDWYLGEEDRVWRVRGGDLYPEKGGRVLIYPQATKYLATQRDPFAANFDLFRRTLGNEKQKENVLSICGFSFGDEHINQEIDIAMRHPDNKTTVLAFSKELNPALEKWRKSVWGKRLYAITAKGLYVGDQGPFCAPVAGGSNDWWTFEGVTKVLNCGAEGCII